MRYGRGHLHDCGPGPLHAGARGLLRRGRHGPERLAGPSGARAGISALFDHVCPRGRLGQGANWGDRRQDTDRLPHVRPAFASRLPQELNEIRTAGGEIVVIDTAPHSDNVTLGAAKVSDLVLIPCRPSIFDLEALAVTVELVKTAQVPILAVLNAVVPHVADTAQAEEAIGRLGVTVCPIHISRRVAFSRAVLRGLTAQEYEPQGKAAREIEQFFQTIQGVAQEEHAAGGRCDG